MNFIYFFGGYDIETSFISSSYFTNENAATLWHFKSLITSHIYIYTLIHIFWKRSPIYIYNIHTCIQVVLINLFHWNKTISSGKVSRRVWVNHINKKIIKLILKVHILIKYLYVFWFPWSCMQDPGQLTCIFCRLRLYSTNLLATYPISWLAFSSKSSFIK